MNRPDLYLKTIDVLKEAYFNDELEHGKCARCAVGNICKEAAEKLDISVTTWGWKFFTVAGEQIIARGEDELLSNGKIHKFPPDTIGYELIKSADTLIAATGYTIDELAFIERTFECAPYGENRMFNGLVAVVDALDIIHEVDSRDVTASSKANFLRSEVVSVH